MTICIAAISESDKIIAISDKKFTNNVGVTSGYQINENIKIVEVGNNCIALFAGNIVNANEVLSIAKLKIKTTDKISVIADKIKDAYTERFRVAVNDEILSKYGLDMDTFNAQQKTLDTTFVNSIVQTISDNNTNLGIQIVVAGKDDEGPHLFKISHPGAVTNDTPIGYSCIGSGSSHANLSIIESECHPGIDFAHLLFAVVKAKRKAEYDPDVGTMSTMAIIDDKLKWISEDEIKTIWKEYENSVSKNTETNNKSSTIMKGVIYGTNAK